MMNWPDMYNMRCYGVFYFLTILFVDETKVGVNVKLDLSRETLESNGFKMGNKTQYMEGNFNKKTNYE